MKRPTQDGLMIELLVVLAAGVVAAVPRAEGPVLGAFPALGVRALMEVYVGGGGSRSGAELDDGQDAEEDEAAAGWWTHPGGVTAAATSRSPANSGENDEEVAKIASPATASCRRTLRGGV